MQPWRNNPNDDTLTDTKSQWWALAIASVLLSVVSRYYLKATASWFDDATTRTISVDTNMFASGASTFVVALLIVGLASGWRISRKDLGLHFQSLRSELLRLLPLIVGGACIVLMYVQGVSLIRTWLGDGQLSLDTFALIKLFLGGAVLGPIGEEILFRGVLFPALLLLLPAKLPGRVAIAVIANTVLFAALHLNGFSLIKWLAIVPPAVCGIISCLWYYRWGQLAGPILLHMIANAMIFTTWLLP